MKRGDLYWAVLDPRSSSEQRGRRPVLLLSHASFLQQVNWRSIIVLPLSTASAPARRSPTVVALPAGTAGLVADSVVVCHQITTLDRGKLETYIGELPEALMPDVEAAVKAATGMV